MHTRPQVISTSRIDYSPSVIWIFPKHSTCPLGKLRTKITNPIAKSTSPGLSDMTFFARWVSYKYLAFRDARIISVSEFRAVTKISRCQVHVHAITCIMWRIEQLHVPLAQFSLWFPMKSAKEKNLWLKCWDCFMKMTDCLYYYITAGCHRGQKQISYQWMQCQQHQSPGPVPLSPA